MDGNTILLMTMATLGGAIVGFLFGTQQGAKNIREFYRLYFAEVMSEDFNAVDEHATLHTPNRRRSDGQQTPRGTSQN